MSFFESIKKFFGLGSRTHSRSNEAIPRDDYAYNEMKKKEEEKMNKILDKIASKGIESLNAKEKAFLDSQSKQS